MSRPRIVAWLTVAILVGLSGLTTAQDGPVVPASGVRDVPVLLLHGYDPSEPAGGRDPWTRFIDRMQDWGWTDVRPVGYYACDTEPDDIHGHGDHTAHFGGAAAHNTRGSECPSTGVAGDRHDQDTSLRHLGHHFAWYVHNVFGDQCVHVVASSMGGLIARYALAATDSGDPDLPSAICIERIVTVATPHGGVTLSEQCVTTQCDEMRTDSMFMQWLRALAGHPDGAGGTGWLAMGSESDETVPAASAIDLDADIWAIYNLVHNIQHAGSDGFLAFRSAALSASYTYAEHGGGTRSTEEGYWPVRMIDRYLAYGRLDCGSPDEPLSVGAPGNRSVATAAGSCWLSVAAPWNGMDLVVQAEGHRTLRLVSVEESDACQRLERGTWRCHLRTIDQGTYLFQVVLGEHGMGPDAEPTLVSTRAFIGPVVLPGEQGPGDDVHQTVSALTARFVFLGAMALLTTVVVLALLVFRQRSSVKD